MSEDNKDDKLLTCFDFTFWTFSWDRDEVVKWLKSIAKDWAFQQEIGELSSLEHFQGRFRLKVKSRASTLGNKIKALGKTGYFSVTSSANRDNNFYVLKDETRISGPWTSNDPEIPDDFKGVMVWKPFQKKILKIIAGKPDRRGINFLYTKKGNLGKSHLVGYLASHGLAHAIPPSDKIEEVMAAVLGREIKKCYFIDLPRSLINKNAANFFAGLESLKNGWAYDHRYNFREKWFNPPHIWVISNTMPDLRHLSKDRWNIWTIRNNELKSVEVPSLNGNEDSSDGIISDEDGNLIYTEKPKKKKRSKRTADDDDE